MNEFSIRRKALKFRVVNWISRKFFAARLSFSHIEAFLTCNSWRKFFNLLHVFYERALGREDVRSYPYLFVFEVTNVCNLKCPFCLTGKGVSGGRDRKHVSFEDAKLIIDQVSPYIYMMQLYTWGEPLLNKDIHRIIDYAKRKNIYVMLSTNATMLNEANCKRLVESGIDYIMLAIDGGSQETYGLYRVGGDYDRVIDNVRSLVAARKGNVEPFLEWQFIVFRHNEHEVESVESMAYKMGIDKFTPLPAYVEDESWSPIGETYKAEVFNPERLKNCDRPWSHLNVRADGGVASCCYEFNKKDDFANLSDGEFHRFIWNNEFFKKSRKLIVQKRKRQALDKEKIICYDCLESGVRPSYIDVPTDSQRSSSLIEVHEI